MSNKEPINTMDEADIVIAGAGTTACVIAGRLADAHPDWSILLVESGQHIHDNKRVAKPLDGLFSVYEGADQIRYVHSTPLKHLDGRSPVVPVGNIVGGSSSINFMMYNNAAASDFDDWNTPGWSFSELRPFIQKSERWDVKGDIDPVHGRHGRMPVSWGGHRTEYAESYFDAWREARSIPFENDLMDFKTGHGCGYIPKLISADRGSRSNTTQIYLTDQGHLQPNSRSRVRIITNKIVVRVTFDGERASGLEVCDSPTGPMVDSMDNSQRLIIKARKLVVLCSGAFGSPTILERSGIGSSKLLKSKDIEVRVDLPGVGADYQDHELTICSYRVSDEAETLDDYARGVNDVRQQADDLWEKTKGGMTATNGFDVGFKIRPSQSDVQEMGPVFAEHWRKIAANKPDKPLYSGPMVNYFMGPTPRPESGKFFSMGAFLNYPAGRGSVHITSSHPFAPVSFDAGLLSHPADLPPHIWAYKVQREVARRMPFYLGEHAPSHPLFSPDSPAALELLDRPRSTEELSPFTYSREDDQVIERWVRQHVGTAYHSMSTCQMKPRLEGGVVDSRLNVYGVRGLKIADLSICPANLGTNTTTVALIIGEKAAKLIEEDVMEGLGGQFNGLKAKL